MCLVLGIRYLNWHQPVRRAPGDYLEHSYQLYRNTRHVSDNPLICDCQLRWFRDWLRNLKDKDDEMMQKKRTICTMMPQHQEYYVQNLPLEKMNCVSKSLITRSSASGRLIPAAVLTLVCSVHSWT